MKMPIQFDTLGYARKLETAGIPRNQAEAHADALGEALAKSVVVPSDLALLGNQLGSRIDALEFKLIGRIDELDSRMDKLDSRIDALDSRIDALDSRIIAKIDALDVRLSAEIKALDVRLSGRIDGLEIKLEALRIEMNEKFKLLYWILTFLLASHMAIVFKVFF